MKIGDKLEYIGWFGMATCTFNFFSTVGEEPVAGAIWGVAVAVFALVAKKIQD